MNRLPDSFRWAGLVLLWFLSGQLMARDARDISELQAGGHLKVTASLAPAGNIVPGEKVTLSLKIATDSWFSGGTRISLPEVPGLVILQTEQFASNASESRGGKNWVIQRWSLDVYPQRAGEFTLPPFAARVKLNDGEGAEVEGKVFSPPLDFTVTVPDSLAELEQGAEQWVAAPAFEVRQSFDKSLDNLRVGDAFEREIIFEASDVLAMMLPAFGAEAIPGLAAYPSPPSLNNSNNRGETRASRSQRISYVVETGGSYQLPARDFFWWDTTSDQLRLLSLPATEFTVGAGLADATKATGKLPDISPRQVLVGALGLAVFAGLLWLAWKLVPRLPLTRFRAGLARLWRKARDLRKPALPQNLNPGSSAGD